MSFVPINCELCGSTFAVLRKVAWKTKYCPSCREIRRKEREREQNERRKALRAAAKQQAAESSPAKKYKSLDEHVRALSRSGTTYAEEQSWQTVERFARVNIEGGVSNEKVRLAE